MARFLALTFTLTLTALTTLSTLAQSHQDTQPPQDTLRLTLAGAEKTFLDSNFQLLAQRYNIDAQDALVIQARLYPNPNFSIGHTLYSAQLRQFFPTGINDETTMQLDQEILLAGKRNKAVSWPRPTPNFPETSSSTSCAPSNTHFTPTFSRSTINSNRPKCTRPRSM